MSKFNIAFAVIASVLSLSACATYYSAKPIAGVVIDADSGEPLEGVNVVAHWVMVGGTSGRWQGDLEVLEAVTDKKGEYRFPAWGPKAIPAEVPAGTRLTNQDPVLIFFKPGYEPRQVWNETRSSMLSRPYDMGDPVRDSQWDGKVVRLRKAATASRTYALSLSTLLSGVSIGGCGWKRIPQTIVALNNESNRLQKLGVVNHSVAQPSIADLEANEARHNCGRVREFLGEYQK